MAKTKLQKFISYYKEDPKEVSISDEDGTELIKFKVKQDITLLERMDMVHEYADFVFDVSDGDYDIANFNPTARIVAEAYIMLKYLTDINLPKDAGEIYDLATMTDVLEKIDDNTYVDIDEIIDEAEELVQVRLKRAENRSELDGVVTDFMPLLNSFADKFGDVDRNDLNELLNKFKGVNSESIVSEILKDSKKDNK